MVAGQLLAVCVGERPSILILNAKMLASSHHSVGRLLESNDSAAGNRAQALGLPGRTLLPQAGAGNGIALPAGAGEYPRPACHRAGCQRSPLLLQHPRSGLNKLQHKRTAQRESGTQKPLIMTSRSQERLGLPWI